MKKFSAGDLVSLMSFFGAFIRLIRLHELKYLCSMSATNYAQGSGKGEIPFILLQIKYWDSF